MDLPRYAACEDMWIITTYYNPARYQSRRRNYELFVESLQQSGLHWLTIENAFGAQEFELTPDENVIQVRSPHPLWQKERLFNLAIQNLPVQARKVAWLDCDLLFTNPNWAVQTSSLLDEYPIVQPFEWRVRLNQQGQPEDAAGDIKPGFVARWMQDQQSIYSLDINTHGSPGYAWAAQRSLLEKHGLYDCRLSGNGDHVMAHAMVGDFDGPCIRSTQSPRPVVRQERAIQRSRLWQRVRGLLGPDFRKIMWRLLQIVPVQSEPTHMSWQHFLAWGRPFFNDVQGRLYATPGKILHLWHGGSNDRNYSLSQSEFNRLKFNPYEDLRLGPSGCWEWASDKPEMHRWAADYFDLRREDG